MTKGAKKGESCFKGPQTKLMKYRADRLKKKVMPRLKALGAVEKISI
jgi:hypothetical protein